MSTDDTTTLDTSVLAALYDSVGGDDAFIADLIETYLSDGAVQLAAIDEAVRSSEAEALVRPAIRSRLQPDARREPPRRAEPADRDARPLGFDDGGRRARRRGPHGVAGVEAALRAWLSHGVSR